MKNFIDELKLNEIMNHSNHEINFCDEKCHYNLPFLHL